MRGGIIATIIAGFILSFVSAEDKDIPLGIEGVTGLRSNYFYRGFDLADTTLDFQVETEVAVEDDLFINVGAWYAAEGEGDFNQASVSVGVTKEWDEFSLSLLATYHDFSGTLFESGFDLGGELRAEAWYVELEAGYYQKIDDDSFVVLSAGMSAVDDYYGREGLNDLYSRVSYTRNLNDFVSLTPFIGVSIAADGSDPLTDDAFEAGLWFEVSF